MVFMQINLRQIKRIQITSDERKIAKLKKGWRKKTDEDNRRLFSKWRRKREIVVDLADTKISKRHLEAEKRAEH